MASLAVKYRPTTFDDVVGQNVVVHILKSICQSDKLANRNFLLVGPAGTGKAQPLYSKVLTPNGFISMKDVSVGTKVFTGSGNIGTVSGIYPQGVRPIYEITLQDRTKIRVSDEHLNVVYRYNTDTKKREDYTLTTLELLKLFEKSRFKIRMDIPEVCWEEQPVPVDPYLIGALIGDGTLCGNNFRFSNSEDDVVAKVDDILRRDWNKMLVKRPGNNVDYYITNANSSDCKYIFHWKSKEYHTIQAIQDELIAEGYPRFDGETILNFAQKFRKSSSILKNNPELASMRVTIDENYHVWTQEDPLRSILRDLGLRCKSVDKHIPDIYLYNSKDVRIRLLQGLFDTDGFTDKSGPTTFTTCSGSLSEDFAFLVRSLGIRDTVADYPSKYKRNGEYFYTGTIAYDHNIKIPNDLDYCTSKKHCGRRMIRQNNPMRNIVSIEYVGEEECQCIMVDHPDHTYISDGFIPTHNTTLARILANELNGNMENYIELDAASNSGVDTIRNLIQQMRTYPIGSKYKVFVIDECHALSNASWQCLLKTLEESPASSIIVLCTTNPEKIPETIISRVQLFQLSKLSTEQIANRLKYVLDEEKKLVEDITYTDTALQFLAKISHGGMRDSLSRLDEALAYSHDITTENLISALNLPDYDDFFTLLSAIAKRDNTEIAGLVDRVYNSGTNFVKWFQDFHSFIINIVKFIFTQDIAITELPPHYLSKVSKYTTAHANTCLRLSNRLIKMNYELAHSSYQQEVVLTYLLAEKKG